MRSVVCTHLLMIIYPIYHDNQQLTWLFWTIQSITTSVFHLEHGFAVTQAFSGSVAFLKADSGQLHADAVQSHRYIYLSSQKGCEFLPSSFSSLCFSCVSRAAEPFSAMAD